MTNFIQASDAEILEKYREVFQKFSKEGVIDMDRRLKHKFGYQAQRLEHVVRLVNGIVPPNRQSVYYITLFKKGSGQKSVGLFNFPITDNMLLLIPQRTIHSSQYKSLLCSGYILNFNLDFFLNNSFPKKLITHKKVFKSSLKPWISINRAQTKLIETIFLNIMAENAAAQPEKKEMIAIKILELLILCDRFFTEAQAIGDQQIFHPLVEKFNELIEKKFTTHRSVAFYASALHIHPSYLNALVKNHNGLTAKRAIDSRILLEAKYLLANTTDSVKEIAYALGFTDVNYFSSFFRKLTACSPTQYREQLNQSGSFV